MVKNFDRKMRIPRWLGALSEIVCECTRRSDVLGVVVRLELHAGPAADGPDLGQPHRTRDCVINLPSEDLAAHADRLALTICKNPVPESGRSL